MTRREVTAAGRRYRVADDDAPRAEQLWWAVLRVRVVDELTGAPPVQGLRIATTTPLCVPRVADGGVCGLAARPRDVSSALVTPGALTAEVSAPGYLSRSLTAAIDEARRTVPFGAALDALSLSVLPDEAHPRSQFVPGRGVMLEREVPTDPEQLNGVADPASLPADNIVPLTSGVRPQRSGAPMAAGVPIVLADQPLHRAALVRLRGRAARAGGLDPAQARIGIDGVWWTYPEAAGHSTPQHDPRLACLGAALSFDHPRGASVRLCTPGVPSAAALAAGARRETTQVEVLPWTALDPAGGDLLEFELPHSAEREFAVSAGFTAPADPGLPAAVRLRTPLVFPHGAGAPLVRSTFSDSALGMLEREAQRGDRVLFLTGTLGADALLRLDGGSAREELRFVRRLPSFDPGLSVPVQSDGSFEFPPLARVAQVRVRAQHGASPEIPMTNLALDYRGENHLHIQFP